MHLAALPSESLTAALSDHHAAVPRHRVGIATGGAGQHPEAAEARHGRGSRAAREKRDRGGAATERAKPRFESSPHGSPDLPRGARSRGDERRTSSASGGPSQFSVGSSRRSVPAELLRALVGEPDAERMDQGSGLERFSGHATLADDRPQRPCLQLRMVGNGNRHRAGWRSPLHDHVAASASYLRESVRFEDPTDRASREDAKSSHVPYRTG